MLNVSELYGSIQGEGNFIGCPALIVRLAGCNLRCAWCDTGRSQREKSGRPMTTAELAEIIATATRREPGRLIVMLTGGEPALQAQSLCEVVDRSRELIGTDRVTDWEHWPVGAHIYEVRYHVETNGTILTPEFTALC